MNRITPIVLLAACVVLPPQALLWAAKPLQPVEPGSVIQYDAGLQTPDRVMQPFTQYKGEVLVLNFWATWCPYCRAELPALNELHSRLQGQRVRVLRVTREDPAVVKTWLKDNPVNFPVLCGNLSPAELPVGGFPTTYVIGCNGEVLFKKVGAGPWEDPPP